MLQCAAESRIDNHHLAPPQAQNLPDDCADVVHIHLFYDPTRLDLSLKSIAQSIKFIGRFSDKQRQLRQKCQLVSTHLPTPVNIPENGEFGVGDANVLLHATNHSRAITDLRSELVMAALGAPDHGSTGTYLSRSQVKGATRWRNRCRIGGGGCRIASRVQIVCAAWRHSLAS